MLGTNYSHVGNVFVKPDEQSKTRFGFAMARKGGMKSNILFNNNSYVNLACILRVCYRAYSERLCMLRVCWKHPFFSYIKAFPTKSVYVARVVWIQNLDCLVLHCNTYAFRRQYLCFQAPISMILHLETIGFKTDPMCTFVLFSPIICRRLQKSISLRRTILIKLNNPWKDFDAMLP